MTTVTIPDYRAASWTIDPAHTDVAFSVSHLGVSKVRGRFTDVEGTIVTAADPADSTVTATIQVKSLTTGNGDRDAHVLGGDFLDADKFDTITFTSTGLNIDGEDGVLTGDLTIHGVTKSVDLKVELGGFVENEHLGIRVGLAASTTIKRSEFGIAGMIPMVGDKITITLDVEGVLNS